MRSRFTTLVFADAYRVRGRDGWAEVLGLAWRDQTFRPVFTLRLCQAVGHVSPLRAVMARLHVRVCRGAGISLPWATQIGPGLRIFHGWGLVVNVGAVIGANVTLFHGVTLGQADGIEPGGARRTRLPVIEDEVWIGPGAVVAGCRVGAGARLLANAVIVRDVPARATVAAGQAQVLSLDSPPDVANRAPL